jgi:hypothetical protein
VTVSQRWTDSNPLIFGVPDGGQARAATATCAIRGLRPGDQFFVAGTGVADAAERGFFTLDEPLEPAKPVRKTKQRFKREPVAPAEED